MAKELLRLLDSSIAASVLLGLASSADNSSHPPISSLSVVETVKFSAGTCSPSSSCTVQSKSPWTASSEEATSAFKTQLAFFSTFFAPSSKTTFILTVSPAFNAALTQAAKKNFIP